MYYARGWCKYMHQRLPRAAAATSHRVVRFSRFYVVRGAQRDVWRRARIAKRVLWRCAHYINVWWTHMAANMVMRLRHSSRRCHGVCEFHRIALHWQPRTYHCRAHIYVVICTSIYIFYACIWIWI